MAIIPNTDPNAINPMWANQGAPSPGGGSIVSSTDPLATALASTLANRNAGGGGGGSSMGAMGGGDALSPMTGFASRYAPALASQAYENPWYILRDLFPGISESDPMYQALRDLGGDPLTLFNISQGANQKIDQGAGDFINWLANFYQQQGRVGGQAIDPQALIRNLFGQTQFGADSKNTLGQILGAGDMGTQIRTLFNMLRTCPIPV